MTFSSRQLQNRARYPSRSSGHSLGMMCWSWIQVKHAFDDAAHAPKLSKIVNHVTTSQFFQGLCKMNLGISASDANLLAEKFGHAEQPDLVNYALFSRIANPTSGSEPFASGGPSEGISLPSKPTSWRSLRFYNCWHVATFESEFCKFVSLLSRALSQQRPLNCSQSTAYLHNECILDPSRLQHAR